MKKLFGVAALISLAFMACDPVASASGAGGEHAPSSGEPIETGYLLEAVPVGQIETEHTWRRFGPNTPFSKKLRSGF